jgi:hypothetical protein
VEGEADGACLAHEAGQQLIERMMPGEFIRAIEREDEQRMVGEGAGDMAQ